MNQNAIVLLSGGLDSAVALIYAFTHYEHVDAITFDYGQRARREEAKAVSSLMALARDAFVSPRLVPRTPLMLHHVTVALPATMFANDASILGRSEIDKYETVEQAVQNTPNDRSYIPLRNAMFITIAGHRLLARHPEGGTIILGTRARSDPGAPPGYPDCTAEFADKMTFALTQGAGVEVRVYDPLNRREKVSREDTIRYALEMSPYGKDFLARTVTCFTGDRCGQCLPCQRRKQAFEAVGIEDPAIKYWETH